MFALMAAAVKLTSTSAYKIACHSQTSACGECHLLAVLRSPGSSTGRLRWRKQIRKSCFSVTEIDLMVLRRSSERENFILFGRIISSNDGACRFSCTEINCFVRDTRRDEKEIPCPANQFMLKRRTPTRTNGSLQDVNTGFIAVVDMWFGPTAWRDDDQVHGQSRGLNGLSRDANKIGQTLPSHDLAVRPDILNPGLLNAHRDIPPVLVFKTPKFKRLFTRLNVTTLLSGVRTWPIPAL